MPRPTKALASKRLQRALDAIPELKQLSRKSPEFEKWYRNTKLAIAYTFVDSPFKAQEFEGIRYHLRSISALTTEREHHAAHVRGLESAAALLQSMIEEVEEYWEDDGQVQERAQVSERTHWSNTNQVFVIHGHDHGTRDTVTRFLESLGLEVVILQEQPDQGRTIIEKFEQCAEGDFALALFTPDDIGGQNDDGLQPRARQNVIFEFGYFVGKFGRDRVRALVKGNPEIPSDYSGVLYISLDDRGSWKIALVRELKSSGFEIDANLVF